MGSSPTSVDKEMACGQSSPNSESSHSSTSSNGVSPLPPPPPPVPAAPSPRMLHRSDPPANIGATPATTFVQADTSSFKHVVQMLTGSTGPAAAGGTHEQGKVTIGAKKPAFKLYERRGSAKGLKLSPVVPGGLRHAAAAGVSPRQLLQPEILSPSILDFPSLVLSPVTPLTFDPFNRPPVSSPATAAYSAAAAEERAIAEKGFYLHPSPRTASEPRLLPLFPVTSPKVSSTSSS